MPTEAHVDSMMGPSGITFVVDPVPPAQAPVWSETLMDSLSGRFLRKIFVLPEQGVQVINEYGHTLERRRVADEKRGVSTTRHIGSRRHPFVDAVHIAFAEHRPLTLSPDAIWLLIAQGFSSHVAEHAESLRPKLVRHEGKRELRIEALDLSPAGFEGAIAKFSSLIRQEIDPVLHETLICDFSTTSPAIRTASEVVLMDSFSNYFTYAMFCVCGIPKITIEGTSADWQRIRARVEVIATYGLEWWVSRLRPILDEFVLAAEGKPTQAFFQAIYKPKETYGDSVVTGWLGDLFPYLGEAPRRCRNPVLEYERHNWALPVAQGIQTASFFGPPANGVPLSTFPSGLSSARVKVSFRDGSGMDADLVAGFLAVTQSTSDLSLSPLISWCVTEPPPEKPIMIPG